MEEHTPKSWFCSKSSNWWETSFFFSRTKMKKVIKITLLMLLQANWRWCWQCIELFIVCELFLCILHTQYSIRWPHEYCSIQTYSKCSSLLELCSSFSILFYMNCIHSFFQVVFLFLVNNCSYNRKTIKNTLNLLLHKRDELYDL